MTSSNIVNLQIVASGRSIDQLINELQHPEINISRSPRFFSAGSPEWINVAAVSTSALSFLATVIVALINNRGNGRVRLIFNEGPVKEIDAPSQKQLFEVLDKIKRLEVNN